MQQNIEYTLFLLSFLSSHSKTETTWLQNRVPQLAFKLISI